MSRPGRLMRRALMDAVRREWLGFEPWVLATHRVMDRLIRRGFVSEYRITPRGRPYYLITDAGRSEVGALPIEQDVAA